jgi:hypothetical protein
MNTFKDLYKFLKLYEEDNIIKWLKKPWTGKDKQESLLRLLAGLGLIDKLKLYDICKGNYNKKTISKNTTIKDIFYNENNNLINLKDKGDSSDLTGICKNNNKHLLVTTSKNLNKNQVGKLDIDKILTNFKQYYDDKFTMTLCICIRNNPDFQNMKKGIEETSKQLKKILEKEDTIIIDWDDLNQAYHQFKMYFGNKSLDNIINSKKETLCLKMHQDLGVFKTLEMKRNKSKKILWGHIQRSGKSYIIGGCIIEDSKDKEKCNYLIITTAPNETIQQQKKVFDCIQLNDFNIIVLDGKNKNQILSNKNIILCSKQFLQTKIDHSHIKKKDEKTKSIPWLKKILFDMRFIDESHNGGTTELAKKTLDFYGKLSFTVQITATYSKPINDYNIPKECWILWDLEDIKLCKNIKDDGSIDRLVEKHGSIIKKIVKKYSLDNIISEYSKYPELWLLTDEIKSEIVSEIIKKTQNNEYGWSHEACFLLKQGVKKDKENKKNKIVTKAQFQNEKENLKLWYKIFGKKNKLNIPDNNFPDNLVFMKRIEKICNDPTIDSRFIGKGEFHKEPMIIMAFLPQNNINKISKATKKLLKKHKVIPEYKIICINSKTTNNPKQSIEDARVKARNSGKKGVLVLSGKQCSLGVSIDNCDIVLLLNNNMGFDMIYQMMFRCMTEGKNKKCGFVVDLNIHRVIETSIIDYASIIKPNIHPKEATKFISLQERLINLNGDHWLPSFGNDISNITLLCKNIYEIYSSNTENALNHFLNRLRFKEVLLSQEEQKIFNIMFNNKIPTKTQKELIDKLMNDDDKIKKGIEKTKVNKEDKSTDKKEEIKQINYMDILKHIIPLICLLTIHDKGTSFVEMFKFIESNKYVYNILIDQTKSWWGQSIDSKIIKKFINVYIKYMKNDKETNQIIRTVKELFMKNIKNNRELSSLIDKYLIPQELEKKSNAEVSTPFKLRQEMLDKIPVEFWKSINKVFEPCVGKGGFIIDIIDRFMNGLKQTIPNEKIRYKTIIEKCLFFSDINPTNIFISKLLIDPYNEYKLNYNEDDTLKLDIKDKWNIDGFDAVIGNPPYQAVSKNGVSKGGGNNLYTKFIYYANKNLKQDGYILFINPPTYFGPGRSNNKNDMSLRKDILDKYYYHYINLEECAKHFNVGSKFIYYLIQKNTNKNNNVKIVCKFNNNNYKTKLNQKLLIRDYLPYLLTCDCLNILDKIKNDNKDKLQIFHSPDNRSDKKHVLKKKKKEENKIYKKRANENSYIYPMQATSVQVVYSSKKCKNQNDKKILMSRSGYLKPFYDNGVKGIGGDCFACLVNNETEGNKIIKLINSKLYTFYIKTNKWSGFHNKEVLKDLPNIISKIDDINDKNIYKYFNITKKEIKIIESSI